MPRLHFFLSLLPFLFPIFPIRVSGISERSGVQKNTCPCVRPPSGGNCIGYDSNYQAITLEEAVTNFVDLSVVDPSEATNIYGLKPNQPKQPIQCRSAECLACFQALTERLTAQWGSSDLTSGLGLGLSNLSPQNAPNIRLAQQCKRLGPDSKTGRPREKRDDHGPGKHRNLSNAGVTTPLDCSVNRGDPVGDNSGYVSLCNLCWSLRTLSPKYFPRYVNELSCHQSDKACLNGFGKCRERYRSVDVLYNSGTDSKPKWQQYSINSPISCECQVLAGSGLHNFVSH